MTKTGSRSSHPHQQGAVYCHKKVNRRFILERLVAISAQMRIPDCKMVDLLKWFTKIINSMSVLLLLQVFSSTVLTGLLLS